MNYALKLYYPGKRDFDLIKFHERNRKKIPKQFRKIYDKMRGRKRTLFSYFLKPNEEYISFNNLNWNKVNKCAKRTLLEKI